MMVKNQLEVFFMKKPVKPRVVKVSYSNELSRESEVWINHLIERTLLGYIGKSHKKLLPLILATNNENPNIQKGNKSE